MSLTFNTPGLHFGDYKGIDSLIGSAGDDTICSSVAGTANQVIFGGDGNDSLVGANTTSFFDSLFGQAGNDTLNASTVTGAGNTVGAYLDGGIGDDVIVGGQNGDTIFGGAGNDAIDAKDGANIVDAGTGNDTITGGAGSDTIIAGDGDDKIIASGGGDSLVGGAGADIIGGGAGDDTITGGTGNDTITLGGKGANGDLVYFAKGDGVDSFADDVSVATLKFSDAARSEITVSATDTTYTYGISGKTDSITVDYVGVNKNFANVKDKDGNLANIAAAGGNYEANNIFYAGKKTVPNDAIVAVATSGTSVVDLADATKFYSIEQFDNTANAFGGSVIRGTTGANTLTATNSAVAGGTGDQLWGRAGNDVLLGGSGNDTFWYGLNEGSDIIGDGSAVHDTTKDDVIRLYNVNSADVNYKLVGTDLVISFASSVDTLTVKDWAAVGGAKKAKVQTADKAPFTPVVSAANTITNTASTGTTTIDLNNYAITMLNINNAANTSGGSVFRGNVLGNTLTATNTVTPGSAGDQLWGRGGDDALVGGAGIDTFWYGQGEGNDAITGATADEDVLRLYNTNLADVKYDYAGLGVTYKFNGGQTVTTNAVTKLWTADMASASKIALANNKTVTYTANAIHLGNTTTDTMTLTGTDRLTIDLTDTAKFRSIENVDVAGAAASGTVVRGDSNANVLTGSTVANQITQLWGRTGADTLVGAAGAETFWVGKNEGTKNIDLFDAGTVAGKDTLKFYNANLADLSFGANKDTNVVTVTMAGSTDSIIIGATGTGATDGATAYKVVTADQTAGVNVIVGKASDGIATLGSVGDYYYGTTSNATLKTAVASAQVIDLTSNHFVGFKNIDNVLGAFVGGSVLRGTDGNNTLTAGTTGDQLWGRAGDDTLVGGAVAKADTFWYGKNEGNDVVKNFKVADDSIMLYNADLTAADVAVAVTGTDVKLTIGTNSLTIVDGNAVGNTLIGNAGGKIKMGDGNSYNIITVGGEYSLKKV